MLTNAIPAGWRRQDYPSTVVSRALTQQSGFQKVTLPEPRSGSNIKLGYDFTKSTIAFHLTTERHPKPFVHDIRHYL